MQRCFKRALCAALALLFSLLLAACGARDEQLYVCVLDVGQSECILLSVGESHMLIDTGSAAQRDTVIAALAERGVERLEYLLITHAHEDHYGNARSVLETYPVEALLLPEHAGEEAGYALVAQAAEREGVRVQTLEDGLTFSLKGAAIAVLLAARDEKNLNNESPVIRLSFGTCVLLFTGDLEKEGEEALLACYAGFLDSDFLKVGHHGSDTATSEALLAEVTPALAAVSCGEDNEYGFPHKAVLDRLSAHGTRVYRTDTAGTLVFECNGKEIVYKE